MNSFPRISRIAYLHFQISQCFPFFSSCIQDRHEMPEVVFSCIFPLDFFRGGLSRRGQKPRPESLAAQVCYAIACVSDARATQLPEPTNGRGDNCSALLRTRWLQKVASWSHLGLCCGRWNSPHLTRSNHGENKPKQNRKAVRERNKSLRGPVH